MANRFVWSKSEVINDISYDQNSFSSEKVKIRDMTGNCFATYCGKEDVSFSNGKVSFYNPQTLVLSYSQPVPAGNYFSARKSGAESSTNIPISQVYYAGPDCRVYYDKTDPQFYSGPTNTTNAYKAIAPIKGDLLGYVSSTTDGQHPQDGVFGNSSLFAHTIRETTALQGVA